MGTELENDEADEVETEWVRISERMGSDGDMTIHIENSPDLSYWKLLGMLQSASDFHRTMMTNVFFANECPHCFGEEGEDE